MLLTESRKMVVLARLVMDLENFLEATDSNLQNFSGTLDAWMDDERVTAYLKSLAMFDQAKYHRQILIKKSKQYEIVLIGWLPDQRTSVHGHPSGGCLFRVIEGALQETRYNNDKTTTMLLDNRHPCQYIDDRMGVHEVRSVCNAPTVSLHVYSPPFRD